MSLWQQLNSLICSADVAKYRMFAQGLTLGHLVILALALALSDLVSNKTSIDSLFLDEGFGSLDGDTLEIALSALDSLNASGKMIGIISHVEAMKERIPAQIRVEKGGGIGHSRLVV